MKRAAAVIAASFMLSGCMNSMIDKPLAAMVGQPIDNAIARFGHPTDEKFIAGRKVYRWTRRHSWDGNNAQCDLNYEVNEAGTIVRYSWQGQYAACNF